MEMETWATIIPYIVSVVTGVAGWLVGRRKQRNDFLSDLQALFLQEE